MIKSERINIVPFEMKYLNNYFRGFNAEITKFFSNTLNSVYIYPDMILHGGQDNFDEQLMACEIKRHQQLKQDNFDSDIKKLCNCMSEEAFCGNPFKLGIFILVNGDMEAIKKHCKSSKNELSMIKKYSDRLYFVAVKCNEKTLVIEIENLETLL